MSMGAEFAVVILFQARRCQATQRLLFCPSAGVGVPQPCTYANQHFAHLSTPRHVPVWTHHFLFYCKAVLFKRVPAHRAVSAERSGW